MTSARRRRTVAISVLAPLSAYVLSAAVDWAIGHDPIGAAAEASASKPARDHKVPQLRAEVQRATKAYQADRHRLMRLQREISERASQVRAQRAANAARLAAAQAAAAGSGSGSGSSSWSAGSSSSGGSTYVPPAGSSGGGTSSSGSSSGGGSVPAPPPPPPPPPPPAPPPTQSTTGASG